MSTKKILAVLLALFVLATAVSGCGNSGSSSADSQSGSSATSENSASTEDTASTDGEVPTISLMVVCGTTPPDADAVAEKLSEITREKIGCNVEFITMEIGNVAQQLNLLLSGGDDTLDVFMAGISVPYSTIVNNGQALSLDTLMEPYAEEVKTALGEKVYESGRVNGELYGIGLCWIRPPQLATTFAATLPRNSATRTAIRLTLRSLPSFSARSVRSIRIHRLSVR